MNTPRRTPSLLQILLVLLALCLPGCSSEEPVRIGFIGGLSGRVADLGISGRNGATMAVEQRNNAGGIDGRPVNLMIADDRQDKAIAVREFKALIDEGAVAVIGHMTSAMSTATVPIANENHILMMSPTTTTTHLSNLDDYFFRVCATTDSYSAKMAGYFFNTLRVKRVTAVYDLGNREYTETWVNHFNDEFTRLGGESVRRVTFTSGTETHFSDVVDEALLPETEGILISSSAVDAAMILQQLRKTDGSIPIGTSEWAATEKLIELGGIAVEGVYVSQFFDRYSTEPRYLRFKNEYRKRFGQDPGFPSVVGYDAANVVMDAIANRNNNRDLKQTILATGTFDGLQGTITFNRYGDSDRRTYLSVIHNGKFVSIDADKNQATD